MLHIKIVERVCVGLSNKKYSTHNACLRCALIDPGCCSRCHPFVLSADLALLLKEYSPKQITRIMQVSKISPIYAEHILDHEMRQVYYQWDETYYCIQTKFVNDYCIMLKQGKGCVLKEKRPLACKVFPFWWKEGATPTADNFPLEIAGECTMINLWSFPIDNVFEEINTSEEQIRKELRLMNNALIEHHRIMIEAKKEDIPPTRLLGWLIHKIQYQFTICQ